ncbi:MAG: lasso peptide biosynthesis B2 protein [Elusimicrobia bacterium]|nr:lasso peptide biosynthesis B2 protein [Elusimicrobiota bacterium]
MGTKASRVPAWGAAWLLLLAAEIGLRAAGFTRLIGWRSALRFAMPGRASAAIESELAGAEARLPLEPSCLRRAVAKRLLRGAAFPIRFGVRRSAAGRIEAHAWAFEGEPGYADFVELGRV